MEPTRIGSPARFPVSCPVSVCPYPSAMSSPSAPRNRSITSGLSGSPADTMRRIVVSGRSSVRLASIRYSVGA